MKKTLSKLGAAIALISSAQPALACGYEPMIGQICYFAFNFCPNGFLAANGATLNISQYTALYSLVGNSYGSTSTPNSTFLLPDLRGRSLVGNGQGPGLSYLPLGQKAGVEKVTIVPANLPTGASSAFPAAQDTTNATATRIASSGSSSPISTQSPYVVLTACIATTNGLYPSHP